MRALAARLDVTEGQAWSAVIALVVSITLAILGIPAVLEHRDGQQPTTTVPDRPAVVTSVP